MLCLETWYFQVLVLLAGLLDNPELALDSLSIWFRPLTSATPMRRSWCLKWWSRGGQSKLGNVPDREPWHL
ncbi:hypothetical protein K1719_031168 [Acacia pycnantha]|nr:hypothetical protein K1719_031168 [Acacia pycnantha]